MEYFNAYEDIVENAASEYGVDPDMVYAIMNAESAGNPNAVSPKGAGGLMQLMPGTAKRMGVRNVHDPKQNIYGGTAYFREMLDKHHGDPVLALAAYNAGPGAVQKYGGVPPYAETQKYVRKVLNNPNIPPKGQADAVVAGWKKAKRAEDVVAGWRRAAPQQPVANETTAPGTTLPAPPEMPVEAPEKPYSTSVGKGLGLGVKGAISGALQATYPLAYPLWWAGRKAGVLGDESEPTPANIRGGLESLGFPKATGPVEQLGEEGMEYVGAMALPMPKTPAGAEKPLSKLMGEGLRPTPGQAGGRATKILEEKAASLPILGGGIRNAQKRAIESFDKIAYNRMLKIIGEDIGDFKGHEAVAHAAGAFDEAYAAARPKYPIKLSSDFADTVQAVMDSAHLLPDEQEHTFHKVVNSAMSTLSKNRQPGGGVDPAIAHETWSALKKHASMYIKNGGADSRLGQLIYEAADSVKELMKAADPRFGEKIDEVDKAYGMFLRIQRAASGTGAHEGIFTPAQLKAASRAMDLGKQKRSFSKGEAVMQQLAEEGQALISKEYPDSGTAGRSLLAGGLLGMYSPKVLGGALAARGLYADPVSDLVAKAIANRPSLSALGKMGHLPTLMVQPDDEEE